MQRIIFTNSKGESITLGNSMPYRLQFLNGTGGSETDVQMQKAPFQDGQTYIDTLLEPRELTFEVAIMCDTQEELYQRRADLVRVFNAKLGKGKLRYEYDGGVKEIDCVIDQAPIFPTGSNNKGAGWQRTSFSVICPSPFWTDITKNTIKLEDFVANFRFPLRFPVRFASRGDSRVLVNNGDVETPIKVEFRGEALNPKITNVRTGEFIKVNQQVPHGFKLVINTDFGNKTVKLVAPDGIETDAFGFIDLDSEFFNLKVGENEIKFITDSGNPEVYVTYKNRYAGV